MEAVAALRAEGRSWRDIAIALKVPTRTLHRAWQEPGGPGRGLMPWGQRGVAEGVGCAAPSPYSSGSFR
jgi:hypothetical protein